MLKLGCTAPIVFGLAALLASSVEGGMINFTYAGVDPDTNYVRSSGPGSFSFATGPTTLGLADLTAFQFAFTVVSTDPSLKYADTFTFTRSDLVSFAATLSSTGQVTALAFRTGYQSPPDQYLAPEYLVATSLRSGGLVSFFGPGDDAQHGTITVLPSAVPEPAAVALTGVALGLGLAGTWSRRWRRSSLAPPGL